MVDSYPHVIIGKCKMQHVKLSNDNLQKVNVYSIRVKLVIALIANMNQF